MESVTAQHQDSQAEPQTVGRLLDKDEARYMQGEREPVTSSVLISNSKYLNSPYYRDAFAHQALRRHGHDLPATYNVPMMIKAISEVSDPAEVVRLIVEEKAKKPDFAAWVDARRRTNYRLDEVQNYKEGTLGGAIRDFLAAGFEMQFIKAAESVSDFQYLMQGKAPLHDIEHIVTGFGPDTAGEAALAICNVTSYARYFTPAFAQRLSHGNFFVGAGGYMRTALHYHHVLPTYLDAMRQGIGVGLALKRPLFLEPWHEFLDWKLEDIAGHFGFERGPGDAWAGTTEAASG